MRNIYHLISKGNRRFITQISLVMLISIFASTAFGQDIIWKGGTDNDASKAENWDPAGDYAKSNLIIDTAYAPPVWPRFTSARNDTVYGVTMSNAAEMTIAKPDTTSFYMDLGSSLYMTGSTFNVESGRMIVRSSRNFYLEDSMATINLTGTGYWETRHLTIMAKLGQGRGGNINISDNATYETNDIIRFSEDTTMSIITITDNGKFIVHKDYRDEVNLRIQTGQIRSDEDHDINVDYDVLSTVLTLTARSKDALVAFPVEQQNISASDEFAQVYALQNRGYESLTDVEWKYTTTSGSGYQSFTPLVTGDTVSITFDTPGMYYVVFEGKDGGGNTLTSSEVPISVAPSYVKIDPLDQQFLHPGFTGATITCTDKVTITSREWKYKTHPDSAFMSFDEPVTGIEYTPMFDSLGVYIVACEYVYNAQTYTTKEVMINVDNHAFEIVWNGSVSDDAHNPANWSPMASLRYMTLTVPEDATVIPKLTGSKEDVLNLVNGDIIVEKADTGVVNFRKNGWYLSGTLTVNSGIVYLRQTRLDNGNAVITVNNDASVILAESWFIMGNSSSPTNGGRVNLTGNATFYLESDIANAVWRWVTNNDSLSSVYITDNAVFKMVGNYFNNYSSLVETGDIFTDEGLEVVVNYNEVDDITSIYTRNASAFGLADYSEMVVGVGLPGRELSTVNNEGIYNYTWKYTTTPGSGYMNFDPPQTDSVYSPVFDAAGLYFVVCQGYDSMAYSTTDEVQVLAVAVEIAPQDTQSIAILESGTTLTVTESTTADTRVWKVSSTSGSGYEDIFPPATGASYTPVFTENGTYYVVCESTVQGTPILSNEVVIEVGLTAVEDINKALFQVYPNPSNGKFFVTVPDANSYNLAIFDIGGKMIYNRIFENSMGQQEIEIAKKGLYIVKVQTDESIAAKKIVVR